MSTHGLAVMLRDNVRESFALVKSRSREEVSGAKCRELGRGTGHGTSVLALRWRGQKNGNLRRCQGWWLTNAPFKVRNGD